MTTVQHAPTADSDQHDQTGLAHHFQDLGQQHETATLGMWAFLATEVLFFSGMFMAYTVYRIWYPDSFAAVSHHLYLSIGVTNTAVLLTSSFFMALAVHAARMGHRRQLVTFLILTIVLGLAFLGIKGFEYYKDVQENLFPGRIFNSAEWEPGFWKVNGDAVDITTEAGQQFLRQAELFLVFYYIMTGIHGVHMMVGLGVMVVLVVKAYKGKYTATWNDPVDVAGLYWHFVDVIWIFLLPLLYMVR